MQRYLSRRPEVWLAAGIACVLAIRTGRLHANAAGVWRDLAGREYQDFFRPGLVSVAEWVRDGKVATVYAIDRLEGRFVDNRLPLQVLEERNLYERLCEMLYPVEVRPFDPDAAQPGDVVVVLEHATLTVPAKVVYVEGGLRVLKVGP